MLDSRFWPVVLKNNDTMHPLLQIMNLDYPGLAQVKVAVDDYDVRRALDALTTYFRQRIEPDPRSLIGPDETLIERADQALQHEFTFYHDSATIPGPGIDWTYRPTQDWEWTWALNRHQWWPALVGAYLATGNEQYACELDNLLISWIGAHPPSPHDLSAWRPLEAGLRMGESWVAILPALKKSSSVTRTAWLYYLRSIHDHAEFLLNHAEHGSNRLLMEMNGLLNCGLIFPEFKRASHWLRTAMAQLEAEMQSQVHTDGTHYEYSTGYQLVCIRHFEEAMEKVERASDTQFSIAYRDRLVSMWESVMYMLRPDGKLPMLNDADQHEISPLLFEAGKKYDRSDFIYVATSGQQGKPPSGASHRFPWGRRAVMRDSWQPDALYGLLETAPFGYGHQHEDALTFEIMAYGQPLIGTMGRFTYAENAIRHYLTSSRAHNVVLIDGCEQAQKTYVDASSLPFDSKKPVSLAENAQRNQTLGSTPDAWIAHAETLDPWISNDQLDIAYGKYEGPWSKAEIQCVWERWMLFHKPVEHRACSGFWIIQDRFSGAGSHLLSFLFHFFPGEITWDETSGTIVSDYGYENGNVLVRFADADNIHFTAAKGHEQPPHGWFSREYGQLEAAWEVSVQRHCTFPYINTFVLIPFVGDTVPNVQIAVDNSIKVTVSGNSWHVPSPSRTH